MYDEALKMFALSNVDESVAVEKANMLTPFKRFDHWYATDAYTMIYFPVALAPNLNYEEKYSPNVLNVISAAKKYSHAPISISIAALKNALVPEMRPVTRECKECGGYGEINMPYRAKKEKGVFDLEFDCPVCEGGGRVGDESGALEADESTRHRLCGDVFAYWILKRLVDVAELLGAAVVTKVGGATAKAHSFEIGEVKLFLMPIKVESTERVVEITLP